METTKVKSHWNERWRQVITKCPTIRCNYFISDYGRMKSVEKATEKERLLKGSELKRSGHLTLNMHLQEKKMQNVYVHKFVAENFVEREREDQTFLIHKDLNKKNNYYQNLQWVSREELTQWQKDNGVYDINKKKRASHVKMTESKVRLLKTRLKEGKTKRKILAKSFGISTMQLSRIERGENWGHVTID